MRRLKEVLDQGGHVWIAGDRERGRQKISAPLLGGRLDFPTGAPSLAFRHGAALVPVHTERLGPFHYRAVLGKPVGADRAHKNTFIEHAVREFADTIERQVIAKPADWNWRHPRVQDLIRSLKDSHDGA
jgi:lauroyl/myristoyl acyltransferase